MLSVEWIFESLQFCLFFLLFFQLCLVFTDGKATDRARLNAAREKWINEGVLVYAIGINNAKNDVDQQCRCTIVQNSLLSQYLIIHCPTCLEVSE